MHYLRSLHWPFQLMNSPSGHLQVTFHCDSFTVVMPSGHSQRKKFTGSGRQRCEQCPKVEHKSYPTTIDTVLLHVCKELKRQYHGRSMGDMIFGQNSLNLNFEHCVN